MWELLGIECKMSSGDDIEAPCRLIGDDDVGMFQYHILTTFCQKTPGVLGCVSELIKTI
jgi:hypothetical protein